MTIKRMKHIIFMRWFRFKSFLINYVWYYVYYKHTKKHKKELQDITDGVLAIRKRCIGR